MTSVAAEHARFAWLETRFVTDKRSKERVAAYPENLPAEYSSASANVPRPPSMPRPRLSFSKPISSSASAIDTLDLKTMSTSPEIFGSTVHP
jgi:hypothetical protein